MTVSVGPRPKYSLDYQETKKLSKKRKERRNEYKQKSWPLLSCTAMRSFTNGHKTTQAYASPTDLTPLSEKHDAKHQTTKNSIKRGFPLLVQIPRHQQQSCFPALCEVLVGCNRKCSPTQHPAASSFTVRRAVTSISCIWVWASQQVSLLCTQACAEGNRYIYGRKG